MSLRLLPVAVFLLLVSAPAAHAQSQVRLLATILDPETGVSVDTIEPSEIRVTEEDLPAEVLNVETVTRTVKVQVLLDNGIGIGPQNISVLREGLRRLIEALPPDVDTTIVTTAPQPRFLVRATRRRDDLLRGVDRLVLDSGAGRFVESITEAAERAGRDRDTVTVIIAAGTTSGDGHIGGRDLQRMIDQVRRHPIAVHVVMYSGGGLSGTGGQVQVEAGLTLTKMTGGRYEFINTMTRYVTLLPELGEEVAKQAAGGTRQFRITVQRPQGRSGAFGRLSMSAGTNIVADAAVE